MTISKRNIFFTFLLNLIVIISMMFSGIFTAALIEGKSSYIIPVIAGLFIPLGASVLFSSHRFLESIVSIVVDFFIVIILFKSFPLTSGMFMEISIMIFALTVIIGAIIGYMIKKEFSLGKSYFFIIVAYAFIILGITMVLAYFIEHRNISDFFYNGYENLREAYDSMDMMAFKREEKLEDIFTAKDMIKFIPAMGIEMIFFVSFIYYFITKKILASLNFKVPKIKDFKEFYISNLLVAFVILVICVGLILSRFEYFQGDIIAIIGITIIKILLSINGVALIYDKFINTLKANKVTTIIIIISAIYLVPIFVYIVGFVETIFDFRRLDSNSIFVRKRG